MCNAAKIVPDNKSGTPGLAIWVPPAIARWLGNHAMRHVYQCRGRTTKRRNAPGKNANHTHDVVSNVVNVSTFLLCATERRQGAAVAAAATRDIAATAWKGLTCTTFLHTTLHAAIRPPKSADEKITTNSE